MKAVPDAHFRMAFSFVQIAELETIIWVFLYAKCCGDSDFMLL